MERERVKGEDAPLHAGFYVYFFDFVEISSNSLLDSPTVLESKT